LLFIYRVFLDQYVLHTTAFNLNKVHYLFCHLFSLAGSGVQLFLEIENFIVIPQLHFTQVPLSFFTLFFIKNLRTSLSKVVSLELYLLPTYFCHYCKIFGHSRRQLRFCFFVVRWNFQKIFFLFSKTTAPSGVPIPIENTKIAYFSNISLLIIYALLTPFSNCSPNNCSALFSCATLDSCRKF